MVIIILELEGHERVNVRLIFGFDFLRSAMVEGVARHSVRAAFGV